MKETQIPIEPIEYATQTHAGWIYGIGAETACGQKIKKQELIIRKLQLKNINCTNCLKKEYVQTAILLEQARTHSN